MADGLSVDLAQMRTLGDIARYHARQRPDAIALSFENRETSFAEFDRHSNQIANKLLTDGVEPGQRIAYIGKNSDSFFEILFGAAKAGIVLVSRSSRRLGCRGHRRSRREMG
jgi:acyl-CoA synthetase (AMP-forming)/AMP-acid ligase II